MACLGNMYLNARPTLHRPNCRCRNHAFFFPSSASLRASLFAVAPDMTYLERTGQIKRSGLGRHGPEGTEAHGGDRSHPAGGGAGQTAREHGCKMPMETGRQGGPEAKGSDENDVQDEIGNSSIARCSAWRIFSPAWKPTLIYLPEDTRVCIELGVLPDLFPVQITALGLPPVPTCTSSSGHFASICPRYREITSSASSPFRAQIKFISPTRLAGQPKIASEVKFYPLSGSFSVHPGASRTILGLIWRCVDPNRSPASQNG